MEHPTEYTEEARKEEVARVINAIESKRIPLIVALDEDDAERIIKFNEDLDTILKAIAPTDTNHTTL